MWRCRWMHECKVKTNFRISNYFVFWECLTSFRVKLFFKTNTMEGGPGFVGIRFCQVQRPVIEHGVKLEMQPFLKQLRRSVTTCCTRKRTRRTKCWCTRAEIVTTNRSPTTTAFTLTKSCTKSTSWRTLSPTWSVTPRCQDRRTTRVQFASAEKQSFFR